MWNDITIGTPDRKKRVCSATIIHGLNTRHEFSENQESYWVSEGFLGAGLTIFKDTDEGKHLGELIKDCMESSLHPDIIDNWLYEVTVKHMPFKKLRDLSERALDEAYKKGRKDRGTEIRNALGIDY